MNGFRSILMTSQMTQQSGALYLEQFCRELAPSSKLTALARAMALHLLELPVELLEKILLNVPPSQLLAQVSATCRRLRDVLQSESFWRRRYASQVARAAPPLQESWQYWHRGCVQHEFACMLGHGERNLHVKTLTG